MTRRSGTSRNVGRAIGVAVALAAAAAPWLHRGPPIARAGEPGRFSGPALSLPDLSGRPVNLKSLRGRTVAVNFWATWCAPCRFEIPTLAEFYRENRDRCFEMLGVAEDSGDQEEVARAAKSFGIPYPVLLDPVGGAARHFDVSGLPHTVIIDAEGRVRRVFLGAVDREDLEATVGPLLPPHGAQCPKS